MGEEVSESTSINFIIDGLVAEYSNFLHNLHFRRDLTFDSVFSILVQEETLIKKIRQDILPTNLLST